MPASKRPVWKTIVFSLIPVLLLFAIIEGSSRLIWSYLQNVAFKSDPNRSVNFLNRPDPLLGYRLKASYHAEEGPLHTRTAGQRKYQFKLQSHTNQWGFLQYEEVTKERKPGVLRVLTVGESTTQGYHPATSYPSVLRRLINESGRPAEVLNTGVAGYVSDQWARWAEIELADFRPDVVVFYAGWNDFQSYNPHGQPPSQTWFKQGYPDIVERTDWLKSIALLRSLLVKYSPPKPVQGPGSRSLPEEGLLGDIRLQGDKGAKSGEIPVLAATVANLVAPSGAYAWSSMTDAYAGEQRTATIWLDGKGSGVFRIGGLEKPWPTFAECPYDLSGGRQLVHCTFNKPRDIRNLQFTFVAKRDTEAVASDLRLFGGKPDESTLKQRLTRGEAVREKGRSRAIYAFYLDNLDRAISAYRAKNPDVRIVISTLVGRWPFETDEIFHLGDQSIWWMKDAGDTSQTAAAHLRRFNDLIRDYARDNNLELADAAMEFDKVNREEIMWDFAHFNPDGYDRLARVIFATMKDRGLLK